LSTWLGKLLRIDVDKGDPYAVPPDNPFVNTPGARPEIWAWGLRNPWRFSFDRATGWLFCGDVGQNEYEEINLVKKGGNYGWRVMEGFHCFDPPQGCNRQGLEMPVDEYDHATGISVCGGHMYRGLRHPGLHGHYLFGDWSGKLFYLKQRPDFTWERGLIFPDGKNDNDAGAKINSFAEDESGDVYVITQRLFGPRSPTGTVYRVGW
jgi:glucose/arabinose dehydrogenase